MVLSAICTAIFLVFIVDSSLPGARFAVVFKVGSIALLVLIAAMATASRMLLVAALGFSCVGDFFLGMRRLGTFGPEKLFLAGLVSFLIAHLFYVALFVKGRTRSVHATRKMACVLVTVVAVASLVVLWPGLGPMHAPVLAYSLVLTTMAVTAQWSRYPMIVALGALSFVASDTMLAVSIFGHPFRGLHVLVWVTYYAAQAMIAVGVVRALPKPMSLGASFDRTDISAR